MFCSNCGHKLDLNQKNCTNCGLQTSKPEKKELTGVSKIISIVIFLIVVGSSIYSIVNDHSIQDNNNAVASYDAGDSQAAIAQLESTKDNVMDKETKLNTLMNLGYIYSSELENDKALASFQEALDYATKDTYDYYLIMAEIALLQGKPNAAKLSYDKAYELKPDDFQINTVLALFYLDLDEVSSDYVDYPKALVHAKKAYELSDEMVKNTATINLALAYYFNEDFDKVIELLSGINVEKDPYASFWLGLAYWYKDDDINAQIYIQQAIDGGVEPPQEIIDYLNNNI